MAPQTAKARPRTGPRGVNGWVLLGLQSCRGRFLPHLPLPVEVARTEHGYRLYMPGKLTPKNSVDILSQPPQLRCHPDQGMSGPNASQLKGEGAGGNRSPPQLQSGACLGYWEIIGHAPTLLECLVPAHEAGSRGPLALEGSERVHVSKYNCLFKPSVLPLPRLLQLHRNRTVEGSVT